jgi:hypothetical protein
MHGTVYGAVNTEQCAWSNYVSNAHGAVCMEECVCSGHGVRWHGAKCALGL